MTEELVFLAQRVVFNIDDVEVQGVIPTQLGNAAVSVGVSFEYGQIPGLNELTHQVADLLSDKIPHFAVQWPVELAGEGGADEVGTE